MNYTNWERLTSRARPREGINVKRKPRRVVERSRGIVEKSCKSCIRLYELYETIKLTRNLNEETRNFKPTKNRKVRCHSNVYKMSFKAIL